jgi:5'-nucleotidase
MSFSQQFIHLHLPFFNISFSLSTLCSIAGSCKPAFMLDPYLQLFRVNMEDGSLLNTDGVFEIEALGADGAEKFLNMGKVFQGGNWQHLHKMLAIESGDIILYV